MNPFEVYGEAMVLAQEGRRQIASLLVNRVRQATARLLTSLKRHDAMVEKTGELWP